MEIIATMFDHVVRMFYVNTLYLVLKKHLHTDSIVKGDLFSESAIRFSNLQIFKKKYSKKLS